MSANRRKKDSKKMREKVLRQMKALNKVVAQHTERYRDLLDTQWEQTDWSRKQAEQVFFGER